MLSLVDPSCDFLCSSPNAYTPGRKAVEFLFTETFFGARFLSFTKNWESVTKDSGVLKPVSEGNKLEFLDLRDK